MPVNKITPSSIRETLSIPFQQTARYVSNYEDEVTEKEKKTIDKVLVYDTLKDDYNKPFDIFRNMILEANEIDELEYNMLRCMKKSKKI